MSNGIEGEPKTIKERKKQQRTNRQDIMSKIKTHEERKNEREK